MSQAIAWLATAPIVPVAAVLLIENLVLFLGALAGGAWLRRRFAHRPVSLAPDALAGGEVAAATGTVLLNVVITFVGLWGWRAGIIRFRTDVGPRAWLDVLVLLLVMDFLMYWLHRMAHHPRVFPWLHRLHHEFERPRPLTLFVLHPLENLSFGFLWLAVIAVYPASWLGMSVYLALNLIFGTLGHVGVEPFPDRWARIPVLRQIGSSSFHARHHQDLSGNFGFYTLLWDRLFGTLAPGFEAGFGRLPGRQADT